MTCEHTQTSPLLPKPPSAWKQDQGLSLTRAQEHRVVAPLGFPSLKFSPATYPGVGGRPRLQHPNKVALCSAEPGLHHVRLCTYLQANILDAIGQGMSLSYCKFVC